MSLTLKFPFVSIDHHRKDYSKNFVRDTFVCRTPFSYIAHQESSNIMSSSSIRHDFADFVGVYWREFCSKGIAVSSQGKNSASWRESYKHPGRVHPGSLQNLCHWWVLNFLNLTIGFFHLQVLEMFSYYVTKNWRSSINVCIQAVWMQEAFHLGSSFPHVVLLAYCIGLVCLQKRKQSQGWIID